ncbi:MAG: ABC transporter substrate-binding protein, partial [Candidatus Riflebacteria bacterium]|nr:ABC transporter substrate-binding protein [Candidatus Riflebacteria bacterium]
SEEICKELEKSKKIKVYYAQGPKGLNSSASGTSHGEIIDMAGGFNVVERNSAGDGRISVNMEQVMIWNPEVILLADRIHSASPKEKDPNKLLQSLHDGWKNIKACKDGKVYFVPCIPYNVLDMPPSVNRIIGILWLGDILYPGKFTKDIRKEFVEFYDLFYNYKLNDKELDEFLFKNYK